MPFLGEQVAVRQHSDSVWETLETLAYEGRSETFTVPKGFKTNFASVPHALTWLVPRYGRYTRAAVLHDYLCVNAGKGGFPLRHDADGIFRRSMRELDVSFLRRWLMWVAVRLGAGWTSLWKPGLVHGLGVLALAAVAFVFLAVPVVVVAVWMAVFWVLEWVVFPGLKMLSRRKRVNRPRLSDS